MSDPTEQPTLNFVKSDAAFERVRIKACNRILLYARGLDLDAKAGLELASASLERAGDGAGFEDIMDAMQDILLERGVDFRILGRDNEPLASAPPLCRTSLVSGKADTGMFFRLIGFGFGGLWKLATIWKAPWKTRKT